MEIRKVLALRGPNVWANFPVLEAWVDLGPYKDSPSTQLPGLNDRLMDWLPSMIEHRCSEGARGGFFQRLREGTWLGHILEHVTLELQSLAGTEVGYGRARETSTGGVYKVVVEYDYEALGRAALATGHRLCLAAIKGEPFDVAAEVEALRQLHARVAPSAEAAALRRAARKRRIPVHHLDEKGLLQLGHGAKQRRVRGAVTDQTGVTAEATARDNHLTLNLLRSVGVPVPAGELADGPLAAREAALSLGLPVSLRPRYGHKARPEWARLESPEQVEAACREADDEVLVERPTAGATHRLLVVAGRVVAALREGQGGPEEVTARLHPDVSARAVDAARAVGLDVAAVEAVAEDVSRPLEGGACVRAVHARPGLEDFLRPAAGEPRPVAEAIVSSLIPEGDNGRIPLVCVTGTNGKTTTTRLVAHLLGRVYSPVGMCCSEGIWVGQRLIEEGDCSGPKSARSVLHHPDARAASLEVARGGILREGLGFDRCLVAVVTNIGAGDHLGLGDVNTLEQLAKVKRTIVDVVLPEGAAVLNAADPLVAAMAEHCKGSVIFFGRDPGNPVIAAHLDQGKRAAYERDGALVLAEGSQEAFSMPLASIPLTHGGRVGFNIENALASAAAAWAAGVPFAEVRAGLEAFGTAIDQVPCRFNLLDYRGATIVLDYAHNISALQSFLTVLPHFPHRARSVIYSVPGDRSDEVIIRQGEMIGAVYDRVILFEDTEVRGRPDGQIFALMRQGIARGGRAREVVDVRGNLNAIDVALSAVRPGELLVVQPEVPAEAAEYFTRLLAAGAQEVSFDRACGAPEAPSPLDVRG